MSTLTYSMVAANVANALANIAVINNLVMNGNENLLTVAQNSAMQNINTFFTAHPGGFVNFTFTSPQANDFVTFGNALLNLPNTGILLTTLQSQAAAGVPTVITSAFPNGAQTVTFNDGYFIVEVPGTGQFQISNIDDGTTWDVLAVGTAEATSDYVIRVDVLNGELITWGYHTIQFFTDQALPIQPYAAVVGATQDYGLAAIYSVCQFNNSLIFLGQNFEGVSQVFMLQGYTPTAVSTPDINNLINSFHQVNDAIGQSFVIDGHTFYLLTFPYAGYSFLFDGLTQMWSIMRSGVGDSGRHNSSLSVTFNNQNFVSDYISGNVYFWTTNSNVDNGLPIKRQVITRHIFDQGNEFGIDQLWLDMQTGVAGQPGTANANCNMSLYVSKDGGQTYGNERSKPMGLVGQYKNRIVFNRFGSSRDFVFKITCTDDVPFILNQGAVIVREGTEPR